jgi:hypothetical protein
MNLYNKFINHSEFLLPSCLTSSKYVYCLTSSVCGLFSVQNLTTTFLSGWSSGNTSTRQQKFSSIDASNGVDSFGVKRRSFKELVLLRDTEPESEMGIKEWDNGFGFYYFVFFIRNYSLRFT